MLNKHSKEKCNSKTVPMNCKYCEEKIYYFSCDCGCKVFFEKLGPPWPRHRCRGLHDKPLSGFQIVRINGYEYCFDPHLVERLKSAYNADRARNPKAGPGGAVRRVLVDGGIILPEEANHAWNVVKRIVGHRTPSQKRSKKLKGTGYQELVREKKRDSRVEHPSQTSKAPPKRLIVTFTDGTEFDSHNATLTWMETFKKLIDKFGTEKVMAADPKEGTVSKSRTKFRSYKFYRGLYISTNNGTDAKKRGLNKIAERLGLNLTVISVEK